MVLLHSPEKDGNVNMPRFKLKNIDGRMLGDDDVRGENGTVIFFICNHCPYVQAIVDRLVDTAKALQDMGIGVAAIMPNDTEVYSADSFGRMKEFAQAHGFTFPYLIDETQKVARAFGAVCTPDLFGFDGGGRLCYRGRLDSAGASEADFETVPELLDAMREIVETGHVTAAQHSSMGCSIKWRV